MQNETTVKNYMRSAIVDYIDLDTDEVSVTELGEDACTHFKVNPNDYETQSILDDWAYEVAEDMNYV